MAERWAFCRQHRRQILGALPRDLKAALVVVQHIDAAFEEGLVKWLDEETPLAVVSPVDGQDLHQIVVGQGALPYDTAADYDRIERLMALGTGPWYRRQALMRAGVGPGQHLLDVGTGTGLLAREALKLVGPAGSVIGVDPSTGMMAEAHLPPGVTLVQGRAEDTGRPADSADMLTMGYALRHVSDVDAAFAEFHRVLRPGGRAVVLEISLPASRWGRVLLKAYMRAVVPMLARFVARRGDTALLWRYYWDTIESCIAPPQVMQERSRIDRRR